MFGRLQLLQLVGRSERTMAWRAQDPRSGQDVMLVMPRVQPADPAALQRWQEQLRQASRLTHPQLAPVVEQGVQDGWPYAAYDLRDVSPLSERLTAEGLPSAEAARLMVDLLLGLAYAHDAGLAHHDLQTFSLLVTDQGRLRVAGLGVGFEMARSAVGTTAGVDLMTQQRRAAERDVLCAGLLLHGLLSGQPPLDEPDFGRAVQRLPPLGREFVRLPWSLTQPVADALRAIVNRATDRQERQRYRNARTLLRALDGWLQTHDGSTDGPLALLADKLRTAGVLPAAPGAADRAARLALMEGQRTNELAEVVLQDVALSFDLLRLVNSAQVRGVQLSGAGPVLTVRRSIAMLGLEGVRRAALALRPWPGPLNEGSAAVLERLTQRVIRAGHLALALRPAGYDGEVVYLITLMQNLGRLVVAYHFPEEALQIRRLMQPGPPARDGEPEEPGMTEEAAAFAVLGADVESIGAAVARQWGLGDGVLNLVRRHPAGTAVHMPESDDDFLRATASCANEALDALAQPPHRVALALQRVVQRYGRALGLGLKDLQEALLDRPLGATTRIADTAHGALDAKRPAGAAASGGAGHLRAAAAAAAGARGDR